MKRVGHKGADLIVPGNTRESFDAALATGVDMIEFDVLAERGSGRLVLAHDYEDAGSRVPLALDEALAHLCHTRFDGLEFNVDIKLPGYERRVVDALGSAGLLHRVLISSVFPASLARIRAVDPQVRLGWSVPRVRHDPFRSRATRLPAYLVTAVARRLFPHRARKVIAAGYC